jgi:hypothetical protein
METDKSIYEKLGRPIISLHDKQQTHNKLRAEAEESLKMLRENKKADDEKLEIKKSYETII